MNATAATTTTPETADSPSNGTATEHLFLCVGCTQGIVNQKCKPCRLRDIALGLPFFQSHKAGSINRQYRLQLIGEFGSHWLEGHKLVKRIKEQCDQQREKKSGHERVKRKARLQAKLHQPSGRRRS